MSESINLVYQREPLKIIYKGKIGRLCEIPSQFHQKSRIYITYSTSLLLKVHVSFFVNMSEVYTFPYALLVKQGR